MPKTSAGLLLYRQIHGPLEVFLVHPGGPFWAKKDLGAWTVPKGEYVHGEEALDAARREFREETGFAPPENCWELGVIRQASGKIVTAWAAEGDCDPDLLVSNHCEVQWPPHSGRHIDIPEVDRGAWFSLPEAHKRILITQVPLLDALAHKLGAAKAKPPK
jgi:predicted NUDIX family NTP pyrophosphohydrolase